LRALQQALRREADGNTHLHAWHYVPLPLFGRADELIE
jgi:hypothetical protein